VKGEVFDSDEWLFRPRSNHPVRRVNAQAIPGYFEPAQDGDVQRIQLNAAVESCAQSFCHATLQNGAGVMDHYFTNDHESQRGND
jgi:hypothetical protein